MKLSHNKMLDKKSQTLQINIGKIKIKLIIIN